MNNFLFMSLTETHLSKNILDTEMDIQDFNILKQDRKYRTHGGVLIAQPQTQIHIEDEYYKALGPLYSALLLLPVSSLFLSQPKKFNCGAPI